MKKEDNKKGILNKIRDSLFEEEYIIDAKAINGKEIIIDNKLYQLKENLTEKDYDKLEEYKEKIEVENQKYRKNNYKFFKRFFLILLMISILFVIIYFFASGNYLRCNNFSDFFMFLTSQINSKSAILSINFLSVFVCIFSMICFLDIWFYRKNLNSDIIIINKLIFFEVILLLIINIIIVILYFYYYDLFNILCIINRIISLLISLVLLSYLIIINNKLIKKLYDNCKGVI